MRRETGREQMVQVHHDEEVAKSAIVAGKPANKAEQPAPEGSAAMLNAAEPVERRCLAARLLRGPLGCERSRRRCQ